MPSAAKQTEAFLGREADLQRVAEHLRTARVLTLVGVAGIGKTRLAREYARRIAHETRSVFVSFDACETAEEAVFRFAAAFGINPIGSEVLPRVIQRLRGRDWPVLVVLDGVEHVIDATKTIVEAAGALEHLSLIATSQTPLGIKDEALLRLRPLSTPDATALLRTLAANQDIDLDEPKAAALAYQLDGLPLAIELAAARSNLLSPEQMIARLEASNQVLSSVREDRHGTMNRALAYAWEQLSPDQKLLCKRLAMFKETVNPEVAADIWPSANVSSLLPTLVACSWISESEHGEQSQFHLLRAVRAFVRAQTTSEEQSVLESEIIDWAERHVSRDRYWWRSYIDEAFLALQLMQARQRWPLLAKLLKPTLLLGIYTPRVGSFVNLVRGLRDGRSGAVEPNLVARLYLDMVRVSIACPQPETPSEWAALAKRTATDERLQDHASALRARALADEHAREEAKRVALEQYARATNASEIKLSEDPDEQRWLGDISMALHMTGEYERAIGTARLGLEAAEGSAPIQARFALQQAYALFDIGDFDAADAALRTGMRLFEDAPRSEVLMNAISLPAWLAIVRGDFENAALYLDEFDQVADELDNEVLRFFSGRCRAGLAMAQGERVRPILQRLSSSVSESSANAAALNEVRILLLLDEIDSGRFESAIEKIEGYLGTTVVADFCDVVRCTQMLRAAQAFANGRLSGAHELGLADNSFAELVEHALEAVRQDSPDILERHIDTLDLSTLAMPGFYFFRFELHVRSWTQACIRGRGQTPLLIQRDGNRFSLAGETYECGRKPAFRAIILHLARNATSEKRIPCDTTTLTRVLWPGQRYDKAVMLSRLHSALNRIRNTGRLAQYIERTPSGYQLSPEVRVEWVDEI